MRKHAAFIPVLFLCACSSPGPQYIEGGSKPTEEVALYSLSHGNTFWGDISVYTVSVDGTPAEQLVDQRVNDTAFGIIGLLPGQHQFRVSFIDYDNVWLPTYIRDKRFQGWYDIAAELRSGRFYAAIFKQIDGKTVPSEICLVEVDQAGGVIAARKSTNYIACGISNIAVSDDNVKTCRQFRPTSDGLTADEDAEACDVSR